MCEQNYVTLFNSAFLTRELASRGCDLSLTRVRVHLGYLLRFMPNLSHSKLDCSRHVSCNVQPKAASKTSRPRSPALLCIAFAIALLAGYTIGCALLCDREVSGFLCFSQRVTTPVAERKQHEMQQKIDADRHRQHHRAPAPAAAATTELAGRLSTDEMTLTLACGNQNPTLSNCLTCPKPTPV